MVMSQVQTASVGGRRISTAGIGCRLAVCVVLAAAMAATGPVMASGPSFQIIQSFDPDDISGDGNVIVGDLHNVAAKWTANGGTVVLGDLPGGSENSYVHAVSSDGQVIVGEGAYGLVWVTGELDLVGGPSGWWEDLYEACRWTEAGGIEGIGTLPSGQRALSSFANCVSGDGTVIAGQAETAEADLAFRWTEAGGMEFLGLCSEGRTMRWVRGISDDATVMLVMNAGFDWSIGSPGNWLPIIGPDGRSPSCDALSGNGQVVVGDRYYQERDGRYAFRWSEADGFRSLFDEAPNCRESEAHDVTPDGDTIVGDMFVGVQPSPPIAMLWDPVNGSTRIEDLLRHGYGLDLGPWMLREAVAISDDGMTLIGTGRSPDDNWMTWVARLSQDPALFAIVSVDRRFLDDDHDGSAAVTLDGASSFSRGPEIISYVWTYQDQVIAEGPTPDVILPLGANTVTLTVTDADGGAHSHTATVTVAGSAADFDADGDVDLEDFVILKSNFDRIGATAATGDTDYDRDVDLEDFARLKSLFGT